MTKRKSPLSRIVGTLALPVVMYLIMMVMCYSNGKMYFGTWMMWKTLIVDIAVSVTCALGIGLQFKNGRFDFSGGAIMLVAGLNIFFMIVPAIGAVGLYFYIITSKTPLHWYKRIESFMNPFADRQGDGYQVTQGLIALGNGGLKGLGFGRSVAKNLYLPEPQNDFILAIIGEELGFIGFLVLMRLYIILLFRLFMIAIKARDRLGLYLATGVAVMLGLQVVINVAVVTSSMPATGITLPFISYGGTSIWAFMIAMGVALNVSRRTNLTERQIMKKREESLVTEESEAAV